jgi:hypothetical protein
MKKSDDQLRSEIVVNESRAEWGAWAIVVGLVLEIGLAAGKSLGYEIKPVVDNWGAVIADCLIASGVYAEIHFGRKASHGNAELRRRSDERAAVLEKEAAEARERTAQIEKITEWRHIRPENASLFIGAMRLLVESFDVDVVVEYQNGDPEAFSYGNTFIDVFAVSGITKIRAGTNMMLETAFGLQVTVSPEIGFMRIEEIFDKAGVPDVIRNGDLSNHFSRNIPAPNLLIFVAPKPPPHIALVEEIQSNNNAATNIKRE